MRDNEPWVFGRVLREHRERLRLSRSAAVRRAGKAFGESTLEAYESGRITRNGHTERPKLTPETVQAMAYAVGWDVREAFQLADFPAGTVVPDKQLAADRYQRLLGKLGQLPDEHIDLIERLINTLADRSEGLAGLEPGAMDVVTPAVGVSIELPTPEESPARDSPKSH